MAPATSATADQAPDSPSNEWVGETADDWDKRSVTKSYHRMTAEEALKYVADLRRRKDGQRKDGQRKNRAKVDWEKLEDEEHRIIESRARLNQHSTRLKELDDLFWEWRNEPFGYKGKKKCFQHSEDTRKANVKPNICPGSPACSGVKNVGKNDDPAHDLNVYFMFFKKTGDEWKGVDYHKQRFQDYEHFPNQRISVHDALQDNDHNPFKPIPDDDGGPYLRYIHIPANHMGVSKDIFASASCKCANNNNYSTQWIEVCLPLNVCLKKVSLTLHFIQQAMARYHDEHGEKDRNKRVKTNHTLSREFWKGQLHGSGLGRNPIHATHMRPRCSVIPGGMSFLPLTYNVDR
jgi:hypothetical protein